MNAVRWCARRNGWHNPRTQSRPSGSRLDMVPSMCVTACATSMQGRANGDTPTHRLVLHLRTRGRAHLAPSARSHRRQRTRRSPRPSVRRTGAGAEVVASHEAYTATEGASCRPSIPRRGARAAGRVRTQGYRQPASVYVAVRAPQTRRKDTGTRKVRTHLWPRPRASHAPCASASSTPGPVPPCHRARRACPPTLTSRSCPSKAAAPSGVLLARPSGARRASAGPKRYLTLVTQKEQKAHRTFNASSEPRAPDRLPSHARPLDPRGLQWTPS